MTSGAPHIMGIVNVTPDSFSGDGLMPSSDIVAAAVAQAEQMIGDGAFMLDIGGESTRPGAAPVAAEEEIARTQPVLSALHACFPYVPLSIDTTKPAVARAALKAGVTMLNDVSGDAMDPEMLALAAETGARLVLMHNEAHAQKISHTATIGGEYHGATYRDAVEDVAQSLSALADRAMKVGVARENIILDPGIGFGKSLENNLQLIRGIDRLKALGFPVLLGASRKSFIGRVLDALPDERLAGDAAVTALAAWLGADIVRVHDVGFMARVARMAMAIRAGGVS